MHHAKETAEKYQQEKHLGAGFRKIVLSHYRLPSQQLKCQTLFLIKEISIDLTEVNVSRGK
jgi:hypothetical protein